MKKLKTRFTAVIALAALGVVLAFGLAACGGSSSGSASASSDAASGSASAASAEAAGSAAPSDGDKVIKVGASPTPHAEILNNAVAPLVEAAGYTLEVVEFTDYVLPNTATEDGEIDANYFQHLPYLEDFNAEQGTHLVSVAGVHIEPMKVYAGKTATLDALPDGAKVAVPNDTTNEGRALLLLQTAGLIELNDPTDVAATPKDIKSNPHNLDFVEVEAATVPTVLQDVDIAVINTNYALGANLDESLVLQVEAGDSPYVNVLVVKEGNENIDKTKVLVDAITSKDVKDYIEKNYNGEVVAV
jgi:D-methionine transport system substrate-binding protein